MFIFKSKLGEAHSALSLFAFFLIRQIVNPNICNPIYIYIYWLIRLVCWPLSQPIGTC